jgi:hypothetical protein
MPCNASSRYTGKNKHQVFLNLSDAKSVELKAKPFKRLNLIILIDNLSFQGTLKRLSAMNVTLKCPKSVIVPDAMRRRILLRKILSCKVPSNSSHDGQVLDGVRIIT